MKKSFIDKLNLNSEGKVVRFMQKRGFYLILFLCVIIIGVTAILVTQNNLEYFANIGVIDEQAISEENTEDKIADAVKQENKSDVPATAKQPVIVQKPVQSDDSAKPKVQKPQVEQSKPVQKPKAAEKPEKVENSKPAQKSNAITKLVLPLQGDVIVEYAKDNMVYSKTLGDWRTHEGIDIKGTLGAQVKAAADGIVEKIYTDNGLGITIIVDHGNGLKTKYANLSVDNMIKEKQSVKMGDIISGVGDTAAFEIGEEPHLHFEVIKDGKSIDPKTLLSN